MHKPRTSSWFNPHSCLGGSSLSGCRQSLPLPTSPAIGLYSVQGADPASSPRPHLHAAEGPSSPQGYSFKGLTILPRKRMLCLSGERMAIRKGRLNFSTWGSLRTALKKATKLVAAAASVPNSLTSRVALWKPWGRNHRVSLSPRPWGQHSHAALPGALREAGPSSSPASRNKSFASRSSCSVSCAQGQCKPCEGHLADEDTKVRNEATPRSELQRSGSNSPPCQPLACFSELKPQRCFKSLS